MSAHSCYQILAAANEPRAIPPLQQGHSIPQQYTDQITDDALRYSFWEHVPVHAARQQAYFRSG